MSHYIIKALNVMNMHGISGGADDDDDKNAKSL
jgi:hypothetical protein